MALTPPTIGEMRSRVMFENNTKRERAASGGSKDGYDVALVTWGKFIKRSGRRAIESFELVQHSSYAVWVRYKPDMEETITIKTRVTVENRLFSIEQIQKVEQKRFYLYIELNETKG